MLALTSCFYISVRPIPQEGEPEAPKEGFGWLSRQIEVMEPPAYGKQCAWYTAEERSLYFDSMWNTGMAMALISCILGVVVMSVVLCTCCVAFQLPTFDGLFWTCMICFVAQALTFLSWGSELCDEYECTWSSGTGMNLTAAMMWVWAANMIKSFPEALPPRTRGNRRNRGQGDDDDDDDGMGDVYLSNRSGAPYDENGDGFHRDDDYGDWDKNNSNDQGDGYYDEDGNWVANDYDDPDSYDDFDNNNSHRSGSRNGYSDYDNESSVNWAEESDADNFDENAPMDAPKTKPTRKKKKNKKRDPAAVSSSSLSSFDNDDWDDERGSFRY
eukprot:CAMPEP_0116137260 /NCGR_PEP_ID=MMETSP0329-20121206/12158_1 /TAXON_ID=697910 /ORGANISM="Pseudo-nitzschia arenysensis, Strain B593" /LENGTH=327 /DNA_ID=CAMNT_0003632173 /DNA_START=323 /DNA_END=1306 /DNA_ORIENTATION=-